MPELTRQQVEEEWNAKRWEAARDTIEASYGKIQYTTEDIAYAVGAWYDHHMEYIGDESSVFYDNEGNAEPSIANSVMMFHEEGDDPTVLTCNCMTGQVFYVHITAEKPK